MRAVDRTPTIVALVASGALAIGSFLPWLKMTAPFVGTVTKSGVEGGDGWFTLAAAALIALMASTWLKDEGGSWAWMFITGLLAGALVIYEFSDISDRFASIESDYVATSYGTGLSLCSAGAVGAIIAAVLRSRATGLSVAAAMRGGVSGLNVPPSQDTPRSEEP